MKRNLARFRSFALAASLLASGGLGNVCLAQTSPVGTWDCLTSGGNQPGIAYLTFSNDFTFKGYALIAGLPAAETGNTNTGTSTNPRNPAGDAAHRGDSVSGSSGSSTPGSGTSSNFFVFGFTPVNGPWHFDSKGRVIGFFTEIINGTEVSTNYLATTHIVSITNDSNPNETAVVAFVFTNNQAIASTNYSWPTNFQSYTDFNPNFVIDVTSGEKTNAVSFAGKVVQGKRLTLTGSTSLGKVTFRGVPAVTVLPTLDGTIWNGDKRQNRQDFVEFFDLNAFNTSLLSDPNFPLGLKFADITDYPNIFWTTNGTGPGYSYMGISVVSKQKKIGFTILEDSGANTTLRSTVGSFSRNSKGSAAKTKGVIEPNIRINFDAATRP